MSLLPIVKYTLSGSPRPSEQLRDQRGASPKDVKDAIAVSESIDDMVNRLRAYKESPITEPESIGL